LIPPPGRPRRQRIDALTDEAAVRLLCPAVLEQPLADGCLRDTLRLIRA
jgi:hypothetical protein